MRDYSTSNASVWGNRWAAPGAFTTITPTGSIMPTASIAVKASDIAPTPLTVEAVDNHVYFYSDVDSDRCLALIRTIRETDARLRAERISRDLEDHPPVPIWLHIQSGGGYLFAGFGAADELASITTPVYAIVEGLCASSATLIALACPKRFIRPNGFMLIHQFTSFHWGTHEEFKDEMILQEALIERIIAFYAERTIVTADAIREMLKHDTWLTADQCLARGFVHEVRRR